ncbi:MAG: Ig-like domain-containing protein, partial [Myxococcota bacterium]|nr:Ig-like domain-containing protein [Myxococcota bacterium]
MAPFAGRLRALSLISLLSLGLTSCTEEAGNRPSTPDGLGQLQQALDPAPGIPDLEVNSDTGRSNTDNVTNKTKPRFDVTVLTGATRNTNVKLEVRYLQNGAEVVLGAVQCQNGAPCDVRAGDDGVGIIHPGLPADRTYLVYAAQDTEGGENFGPFAGPLTMVLDTQVSTPAAPDLQDGSDTGRFSDDDLTKNRTPTFDIGNVEPQAEVTLTLYPDTSATPLTAKGIVREGVEVIPIQAPNLPIPADTGEDGFTVRAQQVDLAGNVSGFSADLEIRVDILVAKPAVPDLLPASDLGRLDTDNVTSDSSPDLEVAGLASQGGILEAEAKVYLHLRSSQNPAYNKDLVEILGDGDETLVFTPDLLLDSSYEVYAEQEDLAGNLSVSSDRLSPLIIDTVVLPPGKPDLQANSDTGRSNADDITADATPTILVGNVEAQATVLLTFDAPAPLLDPVLEQVALVAGNVELTPLTNLVDASYTVVAQQRDLAGNLSVASVPLAPFVVDTTAPPAPQAPDLQALSDLGRFDDDNVTKLPPDGKVWFDVRGLESEARVTLDLNSNRDVNDVQAVGTVLLGANSISLFPTTVNEDTYEVTAWQADLAGNVSPRSPAMVSPRPNTPPGLRMDRTAPAAPALPDLLPAFDSGRSDTDNITNKNQPRLLVASVEVDALVTVDFDSIAPANDRTVAKVSTGTSVEVDAPLLTDDTYAVRAVQTDLAGNVSTTSSTLSGLVIDTVAAQPGRPDLQANSDSRVNTDNITNKTTPLFDLSGLELQAYVTLTLDAPGVDHDVSQQYYATGPTLTGPLPAPGPLADDTYAVTVRQVDVAGNTSLPSEPLSPALVIDTTSPTVAAAPDLRDASDRGRSNTDNVTSSTSPTFDLAGLEALATVTLFLDSTLAGNDRTVTGTVGAGETTLSLTAENCPQEALGYAVKVKQLDLAGNESSWSPAMAPLLVIDTLAPPAPAAPDLEAASDRGRSNTDNITSDARPAIRIKGVEPVKLEPNARLWVTFDSGDNEYDQDAVAVLESGTELTVRPLNALADSTYSVFVKQEDLAGNFSGISALLVGLVIDTVASPPTMPDLQAAADSGRRNDDNLTAVVRPVFDLHGLEAQAQATLSLLPAGGGPAITATGQVELNKTSLTLTSPELVSGTYTVTAGQVDLAGNTSAPSAALAPGLIIDTLWPSPPGVADLLPASDTGRAADDNYTADVTPSFQITGLEPAASLALSLAATKDVKNSREVVIIDGSINDQDGAENGEVRLTLTADLASDTYRVTATQMDKAGNVSAAGVPMSPHLTIDALPPTISPSAMSVITTGETGFPGVYFIVGNQVKVVWDNAGGLNKDANPDVWTVTMDFSNFSGPPRDPQTRAVVAFDDGLIHDGCQDDAPADQRWTACYSIVEGDSELPKVPYGVTATDVAGNVRTTLENEAADLHPVDGVSPTVDLTAHGQFQYEEGAAITLRPDYFQDFYYAWSFGDGDTASTRNPVHAYRDQGTYAVSIHLTDEHGNTDSDSYDFTIVNAAPRVVAVADAAAQEGVSKTFLVAKFTDQGVADDIVEVQIDWGDGSPVETLILPDHLAVQGQPGIYNAGTNDSSGEVRWAHTYLQDGTFPVTVKVKDDDLAWSPALVATNVNVSNVAPVITLGPTMVGGSAPLVVAEGTKVQFQVTATDSGADDTGKLTYFWDFGEVFFHQPRTANVQNPFHTFDENGTRDVTVTVTDTDGGRVTGTLKIQVTNVAPTVLLLEQTDLPAYEGDHTQDLDDTNVTHFRVQVRDPSDQDCEALVVLWDMNTKVDSNGDGNPANDVDFRTNALGEGETCGLRGDDKTDNVRTHTAYAIYDQDHLRGTPDKDPYPVAVWVQDDDAGVSAVKVLGAAVLNRAPTASGPADQQVSELDPAIGYNPKHAQVCGQRILSFSASGFDEGLGDRQLGLRFLWSFGDGATKEVAGQAGVLSSTVTHQYANNTANYQDGQLVGHTPYQGSVTVIDVNGATATDTFLVQVDEVPPSAVPQVREAGPDNLIGTADDGFISDMYAAEQNEIIYFTAANSCDPSPAQSAGLVYTWDFGDETPPVVIRPTDESYQRDIRYVTHSYVAKKNYIVKLTVTDDDGLSTTAEFEVKVGVLNAEVRLTVDPTGRYPLGVPEGATNPAIEFLAEVLNQVPGETYRFVFRWGDGTADTDVREVAGDEPLAVKVSHVYPDDPTGKVDVEYYTLSLEVITGAGGSRTVARSVRVNNVAPTVTAAAENPGQLKEDTPVKFNVTVVDPGRDTFTYNWDFAAATADAASCRFVGEDVGVADQLHLYTDDGVYHVCVRVTDDDGGRSIYVFDVTLQNVPPIPVKPADIGPVQEGVSFDVVGSGVDVPGDVIQSYLWTVNSPVCRLVEGAGRQLAKFVCDDNGSFIGTLVVVDEDGGQSNPNSDFAKFQITVSNVAPLGKLCVASPEAAPDPKTLRFEDLPSAVCVSEDVSFPEATNRTFTAIGRDQGAADVLTYTWNFGDGTPRVTGQQLVHAYATKGSYIVQLWVSDDDGAETRYVLPVEVTNLPPSVNNLDIVTPLAERLESSPIRFRTTATDPAGDPILYQWTFLRSGVVIGTEEGVGLTEVVHVFGDNGSYTVRVQVSDDTGAQGAPKISEFQILNAPPVAEAGGNVVATEGDRVQLVQGTGTDPGLDERLVYRWSFGDGEQEPGFDADPQSLAHTYVNEADPDLFPDSCYTATLTVKDKDGGEGTDSLCVQVLNQ